MSKLTEMELEGLWANEHLKRNIEVDSLEECGDLEVVVAISEASYEQAQKDERQKMADWLAQETQAYWPLRSIVLRAIMLLRRGEAPWT